MKLGGTVMLKGGIGAVALTSILLSSAAWAQEKIKVGVTATLEGTYTILGVDGMAGFNAAVKKYGPKAGGKELEFVVASTDFASTIAALPDDVDAISLGLGGADAVNFLNQYEQAGGKAHLMGGSIMVDQTVLSAKGDAKKAMLGTIASSGMADTWDNAG